MQECEINKSSLATLEACVCRFINDIWFVDCVTVLGKFGLSQQKAHVLYKLRLNASSHHGSISGFTKMMSTDQQLLFVHHSYIMTCMPAALFTSLVVVSGLLYRADRSVLASINFYAHLDLVEVTFLWFQTWFSVLICLALISSGSFPLSVSLLLLLCVLSYF